MSVGLNPLRCSISPAPAECNVGGDEDQQAEQPERPVRQRAIGVVDDGGGGPPPVTARLADAVPPLPPSTEVTAPVVLFFAPAVMPVTLTPKLHEAPAANVAFDKLT